jgi:ABC-type glycerol-3-phosphate transport system substrate-binding protein
MKSVWLERWLVGCAAALAALSFTCSSFAATGRESAATPAHQAAAKKVLKVWDVFYFPKQGGATGAFGKAEKLIDEAFMKKYPDVVVKHVGVPGNDFIVDLRKFVASRSGPDVVTDGGSSYPANAGFTKAMYPMYKLITKQQKRDLGPYLTGEGIGDEAHYSMPNQAGVYLFYYNKTFFSKAGISAPPKTFAELLADCTALQKVGITPITNGFNGFGGAVPFDYGTSNQVLDQQGLGNWANFKLDWTDPRIVNSLKYIQQMAAGGCFGDRAAAATTTDTDGTSALIGGRGAMWFGSNIAGSAFGSKVSSFGVFAWPKVPTSVYPVGTPDSGYNGNWSIMNYTKVCRTAWNYVSFYNTVQAQAIQWNVGGILPVNTALKLKGKNGVDTGILGFATNKFGHHGVGGITSTAESTLLQQIFPQLVSGSLSPEQVASQLSDLRKTVPRPRTGKLPNPPPCVDGQSVR